MLWLVPRALAGLALLAGPLLVHLLARRNARRVVFPAAHFVRRMDAAAVRLRRPSDLALLLLRLGIVLAAVCATAQPVLVTSSRVARWNARVSRAVLLDTSRSMPAPDAASRLAADQGADVFATLRFDTPDLPDGIDRAVRWLERAAPSRREIVIVSDFQSGALDQSALSRIPRDVGVRLIRAGVLPADRHDAGNAVDGWRNGVWRLSSDIDATGIAATWTRTASAAALPAWISVAATPGDTAAGLRALKAAALAGVPEGDTGARVLVRFAGAPPLAPPAVAPRVPWIAAAGWSIEHSPLLRGSGTLRVGERDGVMVVEVPLRATDMLAPAALRAVMLAVRPATIADRESEVAAVSDEELARWQRAPAGASSAARPVEEDSDRRWLWGIALLLLAGEGWLRRGGRRTMDEEGEARAA